MAREPSHETAGAPAVSVVVPAHDAAATLPATLRALAATTFAGAWELLVVDDASADATGALATAAGARVVRLEGQGGPARARNAGVAAARGALVAFTDADCEPTPGWLGAVVEGLAEAELVMGPVLPDPRARRGPFDRTLHITRESALFETANLGVRREVLERVGGFEAFAAGSGGGTPGLRPRPDQGHFGEDSLFGWRARRTGARVAFVTGAVVHHAVFPRGPRAFVAEKWRLRFFPALVRELPELGEQLPLRVFLSPRSARTDAALVALGAAAVLRRPALALGAVPYVVACVPRGRPWRRSVLVLAAATVAADVVGAAALAVGSVAARRAVL